MKKILILLFILFGWICAVFPQDVILLQNGEEIEAKVTEIGVDEIKYKKYSMPDGPDYVSLKSEVFMITYENGSKEMYGNTEAAKAESNASSPAGNISSSSGSATLYFFRPKRFSASRPEIIIGTSVPDEVILKLKNGRWHRMDYTHTGNRDFVFGIYAINPEAFNMDIVPGETYYFYCEPYEERMKLMAQIKLIDKAAAETLMSELKEQTDNMVR